MKSTLSKNIRKFYLFKALYAMCFAIPVLVLFRQDNGLSLTEIMVLQSLYSISLLVLEVPSGYFADVFGRRVSIIIAAVLWFAGNTISALAHNFTHFLLAEILFAIGTASMSGADSSLIFDTLKALGRTKEYKKIRGNAHFVRLVAMALVQILGGLIAKFGLPWGRGDSINSIRLTLRVGLPFLAMAIPAAWSLQEPTRHKPIFKSGYLKDLFVVLKKEVLDNKQLIRVMGIFMMLGAGVQYALWFYQPFFEHIKIDVMWFGVIFGSFQIFSGIVSKYAHRIDKSLGMRYTILISVVLIITSYLGMATVGMVWGLTFCFFQQIVRALYTILVSDYIHQRISSTYRATIQSIQNMGKSSLYAIALPLFGRVADVYNLSQAFIVMGVSIGGVLLVMLIMIIWKKVRV